MTIALLALSITQVPAYDWRTDEVRNLQLPGRHEVSRAELPDLTRPAAEPSGVGQAEARTPTSRAASSVGRLRHRIADRRQATQRHRRYLQLAPLRTEYRERRSRSVPYLTYLRGKWSARAHRHWKLTLITLRDFPYDGRRDPWPLAVEEVQRVFPNTASWLISCSDAEGWSPGFKRWVLFGGRPYYRGAEHARNYTGHVEVGGPLQYTWGTFAGHNWDARVYAASKGYIVPASAASWRSALGQALAGGWARYTKHDDSHWSASWGRGC